jgi:hypothetical protein
MRKEKKMDNTYTNSQLDSMLNSLSTLLSMRNKIGYIAAVNYRLISSLIQEFLTIKNSALQKYGELTDGGYRIYAESEKFEDFKKELLEYADITHKITLYTIKSEEAIGILSGTEILAVSFIFDDLD